MLLQEVGFHRSITPENRVDDAKVVGPAKVPDSSTRVGEVVNDGAIHHVQNQARAPSQNPTPGAVDDIFLDDTVDYIASPPTDQVETTPVTGRGVRCQSSMSDSCISSRIHILDVETCSIPVGLVSGERAKVYSHTIALD